MTDLTEQWKKGELPEGHYYIKTRNETNIDEYIQWYKDHGIPSEKSFAYFNVQQVLAPVPSYEEWQAKLEENKRLKHDVGNLGYKIKNQRHEIDNRLKEIKKLEERNDSLNNRDINLCRIANGIRDENFALKELLKECREEIGDEIDDCTDSKIELFAKIDEALQ